MISAIICAYGEQPHLGDVVAALHASRGIDVRVIVVDNGSPDVAALRDVTVIEPGFNTGFAGGCNLGVRAADTTLVAFINSDAVVDPDCLNRLATRLEDPAVLLAGATILLADEPGTVNSWGNPVHVLGFSWAGGYGHPVEQASSGARASVSGAVFAARRADYLALGGFDEAYFLYGEDLDLSLRCWLHAGRVEVLADATAWHHYDFSRNPGKLGLLERNRLITVLTTYSGSTLMALAPLLAASEAALALRARREGWLADKVDGWRWLLTHRAYLRRRRNRLQGTRRVSDAQLMHVLTDDLTPPERFGVGVPPAAQRAISVYCDTVLTSVVKWAQRTG